MQHVSMRDVQAVQVHLCSQADETCDAASAQQSDRSKVLVWNFLLVGIETMNVHPDESIFQCMVLDTIWYDHAFIVIL